jgi:hypothetical protein
LKARISQIEAEFTAAAPADAAFPVAESDVSGIGVEPGFEPSAASSSAPEIRAERHESTHTDAPSPRVEPRIDADSDVPATYPEPPGPPNDGAPRRKKDRGTDGRRRSFATPVGALIVLALIIAGGWWTLGSGLFSNDQQHGAPGWHPPQTLEEEGSSGVAEAPKKEGQADAEQRWIVIFSPDDPTTANAGAGVQASVMQEGDAKFLRIVSGAQNGAVTFDVGKGILEEIAGKHALFDIVARAQEGKDTQISVNCDFGALGACERKRYEVGNQRDDFLFERDMPDASPAGAGKISIVSDINKQGKAVDVYEIRVSIQQK